MLTALAASWWPARSAARLPIVAALSGRPAPPQPAHRFALLGSGLAAAGFVSLVAGPRRAHRLIVAGILASTAGMLLLAPLGIQALAALAGHAPVAVRLALRDLARYQARSGAALAAASLAIGIAATIAVTAAAQQAHDHTLTGGNLPSNQLIVWLANPNDAGGPGLQSPLRPGVPPHAYGAESALVAGARSTADAIAQGLGTTTVVELDTAYDLTSPVPAGAPPDASQANLVRPISVPGRGQGWNQVATPYVATRRCSPLRTRRRPLPGSDVVSSRGDLDGVQLGTGFKGDFRPVTVQVAPAAQLHLGTQHR